MAPTPFGHATVGPAPLDPNSFAYPAVQDSLSRMAAAGVDAPELLDQSLIVPAEVDATPTLDRMRRAVLGLLAAGVVLFLVGLILVLVEKVIIIGNPAGPGSPGSPNSPSPAGNDLLGEWFIPLVALCVIGGLAMIMLMPYVLKRSVNKALAQQHAQWTDILPEATYFNVNLEDASTFDKLKILADDYGVAWFDKEGSRLLIEGLRYRYFVLKEDFLSAKFVKAGGTQGIQVAFTLSDDCLMEMTIISDQVRDELKKQIAPTLKPPLARLIEETFDVVVANR